MKLPIIRPIEPKDYHLLPDFLYHAVYIPPGGKIPPYELIFKPQIFIYVKDFGNSDDCGVVAELDNKIIAMAWARIIPGYGNIDDKTPELAISVLPEYRGQNIGTILMEALFNELRKRGFNQTSLSVQKNNPAVRFYERLGYETIKERPDFAGNMDYIMVKKL
jgi:ribosomal protein S18 acetylase RimI-like enzyme